MTENLKITQFMIVADSQEKRERLLYNTHTTAFVRLSHKKFQEIFEQKDYSDTECVGALKRMGFLVSNEINELELLRKLREKGMEDPVQNVTILTTTNCNARCYYCFEKGINRYDMTEETANKVIEFIKNNYPDPQFAINWFGGEPLLNFPIIKYVTKELKRAGYELIAHITTNGSLLNSSIIEYLLEGYSDLSFQITLDGVGEEYARVKKYVDIDSRLAYERVMKNIEELLNRNIKTNIRLNFAASQIEKAKSTYVEIKERLRNCDCTSLYIYFAPLTLDNKDEVISNFHGNMEHPFLQAVKLQYDEGFPLYAPRYEGEMGLLGSCGLMPNAFSCGMTTKKRLVIDADGTIYKCHRLSGRKEYSVGHVSTGVDSTHPIYQLFRDTVIRDPECKKCNILPICQGGCKSQRILYGEMQKCHRIKQIQCELVRLYEQRSMSILKK